MSKRWFRVMGVIACGCALQLAGCQSQQIADILAGNVKATAVEVNTFIVESFVNNAFGLE